ncbi:MAG: hypothetical protein H6733_17100, partial [Alphaproteobacteria bacterium]|nr:hypothetical protein [Alphaproteobacteria bacterium]
TITLLAPGQLYKGLPNTLVVAGDLSDGERVYLGGKLGAGGFGPCIPTAGGLCMDLGRGAMLVGSAVVDASRTATLTITPPRAYPAGLTVTLQALVVRDFGGVGSIASAPAALVLTDGPVEGTQLDDWTRFDFAHDGYRDGCAGGDRYIKSTGYSTATYVGVTLCSATEYKVWLSDSIYGTFHSAADWSGSGEDHCEYVDGVYDTYPQGTGAVTPGTACWSRGTFGTDPTFESDCALNRWVPTSYACKTKIPRPPGPPEGTVIGAWTALDYLDDGYRNDCDGGDRYVKSTAYGVYVGVTLCNHNQYKISLSDRIYGEFVSAGDWSGSGQDHCEYVDGVFSAFPTGTDAVSDGAACWSRGPTGVAPVYEATCASNRWVPGSYDCGVSLP